MAAHVPTTSLMAIAVAALASHLSSRSRSAHLPGRCARTSSGTAMPGLRVPREGRGPCLPARPWRDAVEEKTRCCGMEGSRERLIRATPRGRPGSSRCSSSTSWTATEPVRLRRFQWLDPTDDRAQRTRWARPSRRDRASVGHGQTRCGSSSSGSSSPAGAGRPDPVTPAHGRRAEHRGRPAEPAYLRNDAIAGFAYTCGLRLAVRLDPRRPAQHDPKSAIAQGFKDDARRRVQIVPSEKYQLIANSADLYSRADNLGVAQRLVGRAPRRSTRRPSSRRGRPSARPISGSWWTSPRWARRRKSSIRSFDQGSTPRTSSEQLPSLYGRSLRHRDRHRRRDVLLSDADPDGPYSQDDKEDAHRIAGVPVRRKRQRVGLQQAP